MKISNAIFIGLIWIFLAACLVRTLFFPKEISTEENRYANRLGPLTVASVLDGSYQDSAEAAFSDQAIGAETARAGYNRISSLLNEKLLTGFSAGGYLITLSENISLYRDYLIYNTRALEDVASQLDRKAAEINAFAASEPDVPVYVYYIEKETDIDLETGEKCGIFRYLSDKLNIPAGNVAAFEINSFDDYAQWFFHTDHHWNSRGSYKGYTEVLKLLDGGSPLTPVDEITLDKRFSGSKAIECGRKDVRTEKFTAYRFVPPHMTITVNGVPAEDYGNQESWFNGEMDEELSYGSFYGADYGEVIFDTGNGGENILVLGESHDNAILKLLASGFGRVHAVDLRYYQVQTGREFSAREYVEENGIDKVLFIGSIGFFLSNETALENQTP